MGICQSTTASQAKPIPKKEMAIKDKNGVVNIPVSMDVSNKALKSICKIIIKNNNMNIYATGFFMKISEDKKYLITNNHVIPQDKINMDIEIEIHNHKIMKLNPNNRDIKYFPGIKDITMIEIKNNDSIYNEIEFLNYDENYRKGYKYYENAVIITIQHPLGKNAQASSGRIVNVMDNEFDHNITTYEGSSGCPIILYTENENLIQVIGIHKEGNYGKGLNTGTFIGEIFNNNDEINQTNNNYIIAEIYIKDEDTNKEIQIINSYENYQRKINYEIKKVYMNEEEIKKYEIRINDKLIPFTYLYKLENIL